MKTYTDLEQSKKLAEILPLESADMWWLYVTAQCKRIAMMHEEPDPHYLARMKGYGIKDAAIRCWSLAALLDTLKDFNPDIIFLRNTTDCYGARLTNVWRLTVNRCDTVFTDNLVDACYEMILKLHELKML